MMSECSAQLHTPALSLSYEVFILCKTEEGRRIQLARMRVLRYDIVTACGVSCRDSPGVLPKESNGNQKVPHGLVPVG